MKPIEAHNNFIPEMIDLDCFWSNVKFKVIDKEFDFISLLKKSIGGQILFKGFQFEENDVFDWYFGRGLLREMNFNDYFLLSEPVLNEFKMYIDPVTGKSNFFGITKTSVEKTVENFINHAKTLNFELSQTKMSNKVLTKNNDKLKSECADFKNDILNLKNLNTLLLSSVELYHQKRREYLEAIFKLIGKTILQERLKYPISVNAETLNKTMSTIFSTITEKNNIPEVAIEEIFKVEKNNRVLFRYLKNGKPEKNNITPGNSNDLEKLHRSYLNFQFAREYIHHQKPDVQIVF